MESKVTERNSRLEEAKTAQDQIMKQNVSIADRSSNKRVLRIAKKNFLMKTFYRKTWKKS